MGNEQQGVQVSSVRADDRTRAAPKSIFGTEVYHAEADPEPAYKKQLSGLSGYKFAQNDPRNYQAFAEDRRQFAIATSGGAVLQPTSQIGAEGVQAKEWVFNPTMAHQSESRAGVSAVTTEQQFMRLDSNSPGFGPAKRFDIRNETVTQKGASYVSSNRMLEEEIPEIKPQPVREATSGGVQRSIFGNTPYRSTQAVPVPSSHIGDVRPVHTEHVSSYQSSSFRPKVEYEGGNGPMAKGDAAVVYRVNDNEGISDTFPRNNANANAVYQSYMTKSEFRKGVDQGEVRVSRNFRQEDEDILAMRVEPPSQRLVESTVAAHIPYNHRDDSAMAGMAPTSIRYVPEAYQPGISRSQFGQARSSHSIDNANNFYQDALGRGGVKQSGVKVGASAEGYQVPEYIKSNRIFDNNTKTSRIYLKDANLKHLDDQLGANPLVERNRVVQEDDQPVIRTTRHPNEEAPKGPSASVGEVVENVMHNRYGDFKGIQRPMVATQMEFADVSPPVPTSTRRSILNEPRPVAATELDMGQPLSPVTISQQHVTASQLKSSKAGYIHISETDFGNRRFGSAMKEDRFRARDGISRDKLVGGSNRANLAMAGNGLGIKLSDIRPIPFSQARVNAPPATMQATSQRVGYQWTPAEPLPNDPFAHPGPINYPAGTVITRTQQYETNVASVTQQTAPNSLQFPQLHTNPPPVGTVTAPSKFSMASPTINLPSPINPPSALDTQFDGLLSHREVIQPTSDRASLGHYQGVGSNVTSSLKIGELGDNFGAKIDRTYVTYNPNMQATPVDIPVGNLNIPEISPAPKVATPAATYTVGGVSTNLGGQSTPQYGEVRPEYQKNAKIFPEAVYSPTVRGSSNPSPFDNLKNGIAIGSIGSPKAPDTNTAFSVRPVPQATASPVATDLYSTNTRQANPVTDTRTSQTSHYLDSVPVKGAYQQPEQPGFFQSLKSKVMDSYKELVGDQSAGVRQGIATADVPGQYTYDGPYVNGKFHGYGTLTYSNGSKFVGEFKNNMKEGHGKFYDPSGKLLREGLWINDQPI